MADAEPSELPPIDPPRIFTAALRFDGGVIKQVEITRAEAEVLRRSSADVVVCGPNLTANRQLAGEIERTANGKAKRCPPHSQAGPHALPHFQPDPRPPEGHTFYETPNRKAQ